MRMPFIGSGRVQESGILVTRKQDFNAHAEGGGFRHTADMINVDPPLQVGGSTVAQALKNLENSIISSGTGFLSIGDQNGNAQGDYNINSTATPTLASALNAAFSDSRLTNGGIIYIIAGIYTLKSTVTIPVGITIMGEGCGTIINGEMQDVPMFITSALSSNPGNTNIGSNKNKITFKDLILIDNMNGSALFGEPTMLSSSMVAVSIGSNVSFENITFLGKLSTTTTPRTKTFTAISTIGTGSIVTSLDVNKCYFDGLNNGISFTPSNGEIDYLSVTNCKARIYGTEDITKAGYIYNNFINISQCNLNILDNYVVGVGQYLNTFLYISSGSINTDNNKVKTTIIGNSGSPYDLSSATFIFDNSSTRLLLNVCGNSWNSQSNNWYITVGGSDNNYPSGDFYGSNAIDLISLFAANISGFQATVIVNYGTYILTKNYYGNIKFIGNKKGKSYPIFELNLSPSTPDNLGNIPIIVGNLLEGIEFVSTNNKHSIRPCFEPDSINTQSAGTFIFVKDCIFIDTSLYFQDLGASYWQDIFSNQIHTNISVKYCEFLQKNTFTNTYSLIAPKADNIDIENCIISGYGYAISVGKNSYIPENSSKTCNLNISNTTCDLTDCSITSSDDYNKYYVYVDDVFNLNIENFKVYTDSNYDTVSSILNSLLINGINKFVYLKANNIKIDNSIFVGPSQTFSKLYISYSLPTVFCEAYTSATINDSKFISGALPLQFGGETLKNANFKESIKINNCYFNSIWQTLLDFDLNLTNKNTIAYIDITNSNFKNGTTINKTLHINMPTQTKEGVIQLYTGNSYVNFSNNLIDANLTSTDGAIIAGLCINSHISYTDQINNSIIQGNNFYIKNTFTSADASKAATCCFVRSSGALVQNNIFSMYNNSSVSSSFTGCLMLESIEVTASSYSACNVNGNIFSRRNLAGVESNLARGYIQITLPSSSFNGGMITNNFFDSSTYNGSDTNLIEDNSIIVSDNISKSLWIIDKNKNQNQNQLILWSFGNKSINLPSVDKFVFSGDGYKASSIYSSKISDFDSVNFKFVHSDGNLEFNWAIPLSSVLPYGVTIQKVSYKHQSSVATTTSTLNVSLLGNDGVDESGIQYDNDTDLHSESFSPSLNFTTKSTDNIYLLISFNAVGSSDTIKTISRVVINYVW